MFKQCIILVLALFLTGCNFKLSEPTDKGCIENIEDLKKEETSWTCSSLDRFSESVNVYDYRPDFKSSPIFETNKYLPPEEVSTKNVLQGNHFEYQSVVLKLKSGLADVLFNPYFLLFTLGYIVFMTAINKTSTRELMFNGSGVGVILLIFYFLFIMLKYSNEIQTQISRATQMVGNGLYRTIVSAVIIEDQYEKIELSKNYEYEASSDILSLFKINTCLSNNAKYELKEKETNSEHFDSVGNMLVDYNAKNKTYIKTLYEDVVVDPAIGVMGTPFEIYQARKAKLDTTEKRGKIAYQHKTIGNYTTISKVIFDKCGSLSFETASLSENLVESMKKVNFKNSLEKAIKNKNYDSGWQEIESSYKSIYPNLYGNQKGMLIKMLIAYTTEYKKSMMIGMVIYNDRKNAPAVIASDFSVMEERMKVADDWYKKTNKAICLQNSTMVKKTIEKFEDFTPEEGMLEYQCIDFGEDLTLSIDKIYHEEKDKMKIKELIKELRNEALAISTGEINALSDKYNEVNKSYIEKVNGMFDLDKDVVRYINEGMASSGRFFKSFYGKDNEYRYMFREISDVGTFDFSKSLPHFANQVPLAEGTSLNYFTPSFVNQFLKNSDEMDSYKSTLISGTLASNILENKVNIGGEAIEEGFQGGSNNMINNVFSGFGMFSELVLNGYRSSSSVSQGFSNYQCLPEAVEVDGPGGETIESRDSSKCLDFNNFDGLSNWTNLSTALSSTGTSMVLISKTIDFSTSTARFLKNTVGKGEGKKNDGKTFSAGSMFGNGTAVATLSGVSASSAKIIKRIGYFFITLSALMKLVFEFPSIVNMFMLLTTTLYLISLPFVMMYAISVSIITNVTYSDYKKSARFILDLMLHPIKIVLYSQVAIFLSVMVLIILLQIMPYMTYVLADGIGMISFMGDWYQAISIIIGSISVSLIIYIYYKSLGILGENLSSFDTSAQFTSAISASVEQIEKVKNTMLIYKMGYNYSFRSGLGRQMRGLTVKTKMVNNILGSNNAREINDKKNK